MRHNRVWWTMNIYADLVNLHILKGEDQRCNMEEGLPDMVHTCLVIHIYRLVGECLYKQLQDVTSHTKLSSNF